MKIERIECIFSLKRGFEWREWGVFGIEIRYFVWRSGDFCRGRGRFEQGYFMFVSGIFSGVHFGFVYWIVFDGTIHHTKSTKMKTKTRK